VLRRGAHAQGDPREALRKAAPAVQAQRALQGRGKKRTQAALQRGRRQVQTGFVHAPALLNRKLGSHRLRAGTEAINNTRSRSAAMKGSTPRTMEPMAMSGVTERITNRLTPMGGVMRPISTTTTIRMPN